jgi:hypothetical protein
MTELMINPRKKAIILKIQAKSKHIYGIFITVYDTDRVKILEQYSGKFETDKPFAQSLLIKPCEAKDKFIDCFIHVLSTYREDSQYSASLSVLQDHTRVNKEFGLSGFTLYGEGSNIIHFHINHINKPVAVLRETVLHI